MNDIKLLKLNDPKNIKVLDVFKVKTDKNKIKYLKKVFNGKYNTWRYGDQKNVMPDDELVTVKMDIFETKLIIMMGIENKQKKDIVTPIDKIERKDLRGVI